MDEKQGIQEEEKIYGTRWNVFHGGYFSDPTVAEPLLEAITHAIAQSNPSTIVDIGGGTGYLLGELSKRNFCSKIHFVNLDLSPLQLFAIPNPEITPIQKSADQFERHQIMSNVDETLLCTMRSVIHYFGLDGQLPFLQRLRFQMKPREFFIHQSACFETETNTSIINQLYSLMGTNKWFPTVDGMDRMLSQAGWIVHHHHLSPSLLLLSSELAERYGLSEEDIYTIRRSIYHSHPVDSEVLTPTPEGFQAYLDYRIFICSAG
ncbi:MAG: class I SAM-dependent methyltransferase [Atribacterota bacterium]